MWGNGTGAEVRTFWNRTGNRTAKLGEEGCLCRSSERKSVLNYEHRWVEVRRSVGRTTNIGESKCERTDAQLRTFFENVRGSTNFLASLL